MNKRTPILILLAVIGVFALQNTEVADVRFLFWTWATPLIVMIFILLLVGMLLGWLAYSAWQRRHRPTPGPPREPPL